jgi:UDP-N-acetylglucosamine 2-epimerase (non-hydrolysing)
VKPAAIASEFAGRSEHVIVHTGQHYNQTVIDVFFRDLRFPAPDINLGAVFGFYGVQTGRILEGLEKEFGRWEPEGGFAYEDTYSTRAAATAAQEQHLPKANLEAALRSFNRRRPEERNRALKNHAADPFLAPTQVTMRHLAREGLAQRSVLLGDVMTDVFYRVRDTVLAGGTQPPFELDRGDHYVAKIQRPDNTDDHVRLGGIIAALVNLRLSLLLLLHPPSDRLP